MQSGSPAQSCGHRGRRSTAVAAVDAETESITWKDTGCAKSLLISYGIHRRSRFASEVNGEHGSVQGWDDYLTHAGDVGVVITTLWCRQLTAIRQCTTVKYHRPSTTAVLWTVLYSLSSFPYHMLFFICVCFFKYRSYTGINNNIIHIVHALSTTYKKDRLTGGAFDREAFYPGGLLTGWQKTGETDRGAIDLDLRWTPVDVHTQ